MRACTSRGVLKFYLNDLHAYLKMGRNFNSVRSFDEAVSEEIEFDLSAHVDGLQQVI